MLGSIISAASGLLGGIFGQSSANKRAAQQNALAARQHAENLSIARENISAQREFAQKGVQWRVNDAKAAGLHPLYALGANTTSYSPVSVGGGYSAADPGDHISPALAAAGQDIGRAINATRSADQRDQAFVDTARALELEGGALKNELLSAQIAKLRASTNPPFPTIPQQDPSARPRIVLGGKEILTDPNTSNVDDFNLRYGEPGEWIAAPVVMWNDYTKNFPSEFEIRPGSLADKARGLWNRWTK